MDLAAARDVERLAGEDFCIVTGGGANAPPMTISLSTCSTNVGSRSRAAATFNGMAGRGDLVSLRSTAAVASRCIVGARCEYTQVSC